MEEVIRVFERYRFLDTKINLIFGNTPGGCLSMNAF